MSYSNRMNLELDNTKTQMGLFYVIILLTVDSINPVKIVLHVFPQLQPWHIVTVSIAAILYIFISEMKPILYFSVKVFFHSIISIFFRDVQIVGRDNIPTYGPVIFTGNHRNQFVDAIGIFATCNRTISYLVAEKSWRRRVIGDLAWAIGAVPVKRAQDSAVRGSGTVRLETIEKEGSGEGSDTSGGNFVAVGQGTVFTKEVKPGDKIRVVGYPAGCRILTVESDHKLLLRDADDGGTPPLDTPLPFDILKHVDQSIVYDEVLNRLADNGTIGIFPEGGSHDRTDLLPLKVGVALITYLALEKHRHVVPIVPVGLNYFHGHRFRGRLIVEYGSPIYVDVNTLAAYKQGGAEKRRVCSELLERIQDSMRGVLVTTKDYETLELIYTARRLYQRKELDASQKQDLNRRFAEGYRVLLQRSEGKLPPEWISIQKRLIIYQAELNELGIRDHQVLSLGTGNAQSTTFEGDVVLRYINIHYLIARLTIQIALSFVPAMLLNLPVGFMARMYAEARRKVALKNSKVKVYGYDVMLSEKIVFCIVVVPTLWVIYGLLLFFFTGWDGPAIALAVFSMPLFSYIGIMATEAGMVNIKDLRPYVMRLFPSTRMRLSKLLVMRTELQSDLRHFIKEFGPTLGEVYYEENINWSEIQGRVRRESEFSPSSHDTKVEEDDKKKDN